MKTQELLELMRLFDSLSIDRLDWEGEFGRVTLTKPAQAQPTVLSAPVMETPPAQPAQETAPVLQAAPQPEVHASAQYVTAPLVGVFYSQAGPGQPPFVVVGDRVQKGQTLCIIEAMKMMNEITAEIDGVIEEILGENGQMVEYGQNLFAIQEA